MRPVALAIWIAISCAACGSGGDDTPQPDAFYSICGHPGDMGNSLGVGQFCFTSADCVGTAAPLCSTLAPAGGPPTFFCTTTCNPTDAGPSDPDAGLGPCGEAATCECAGGGCGCTPDSCAN